ncbi:ABC transporter permease subunit [Gorillibacterium sp. sgz500922]|uniref:ABC transporter permease subunit n=1 Tax=Gorillibacterium sp. sgz500922 TaxID=3446694 RepID=UPI003F6620CB
MRRRRNLPLAVGLAMLAVLLLAMFLGPELPFVDKKLTPVPHRWTEAHKLILPKYKPSAANPLGSDKSGVDNLSMLVVGTRDTVALIAAIAALRYLIGVPLGLLARKGTGFASAAVQVLNRMFAFLPTVFSAALLLSAPFLLFSDHRLFWVLCLLALLEAGRVADTVSVRARELAKEPYFEAGHALGLSRRRLIRRYYLPGLVPDLLIGFCQDLGKVMLLLGQLGVLSIFLTQRWVEVDYLTKVFVDTSVNWIGLLASHRADIFSGRFSFVFYPAFAILFVVFTFNLIGEGLRVRYLSKWRA